MKHRLIALGTDSFEGRERKRDINRQTDKVTWCFTPSQPGERDTERQRQRDRVTETETENGPGGSDKKEIPGSGLCFDLLQALKENVCQLWDRKEGQAVGRGGNF